MQDTRRLPARLKEQLRAEHVVEQLLESRLYSLQRLLAFQVMFGAMASRVASYWCAAQTPVTLAWALPADCLPCLLVLYAYAVCSRQCVADQLHIGQTSTVWQ